MYSFLTILGWFLHGVLQKILVLIPAVQPMQESLSPPSWFMRWYSWSIWVYNLDSDRRPNNTFCDFYISAAWRHVREEFYEHTGHARDALRNYLLSHVGPIVGGWASLSAWILSQANKLGGTIPWWANDAIHGLWRLWDWLPSGIKLGWHSWSALWESIKQDVRNWAQNFYAQTVQFALNAWQWLVNIGNALTGWWQSVRDFLWQFTFNTYAILANKLGAAWSWLRGFSENPIGFVLSWLSPWWQPLVTFANDALAFYYNLWGSYAAELAEFLASPLDYVYDRAEDFISDKIG